MQTLQQLRSGGLKGAKRLKLSCGLTDFPSEIFDLADTLEILDLAGNQLKSLPEDIGRLQHLKIAFFSDNLFTEFPAALAQCPNLTMIGFKANQIRYIPENSFPPKLRWLILTDNCIEALPKCIGQTVELQKVALAGNKLKELPEEMAACRKLELLRISANNLTQIPDWLLMLPRLSWLAFAGNPCNKTVPGPSTNNLLEIPWPELHLEEQLGEGASGIISKAFWKKGENSEPEPVAVKIFKGEVTSDGLPDNEMEACLTAGAHPNLVQVLGKVSEHSHQKQGLVLELIPPVYRNLGNPPSFETCTRDTFRDGTVFSAAALVTIASGIASAAAHLHSRGILHGDLYAHNILVDEKAHPLFGDFGAATLYDTTTKTQADAIERLDVRAFGCLLEDLLDHLKTEGLNEGFMESFNTLKEACMQEKVLERPDFKTISDRITEVAGRK
jgi:hypothetical protein